MGGPAVASIVKLAMNDAGGFDADAVWGQPDDRPWHPRNEPTVNGRVVMRTVSSY